MVSKRGHDTLSYSDHDEAPPPPSNKRQRGRAPNKNNKQNPEQQTTDLTYGQKCVFPGLGGTTAPSDDDLECEDEGDALAYLESVRLEASGIPHVIIAPKAGPQLPPNHSLISYDEDESVDRSIYASGVGDSRGYYYDGAYTAAPYTDSCSGKGDNDGGERDTDTDAVALREAYYSSLASQFTALRRLLHQDPPASALQSLPRDHETEVGPFGPNSRTFRLWTNRLRYTDPLPAQIAAMDKGSALKLLRIILGGKFLRRGYELRERTSRWIWSLLARLPDRGEMGHTDVGWVREIGKRAVLMLISIAQMAALREEVDDDIDRNEYHGDEEGTEDDEEFLEEMAPEEDDSEPPSSRTHTSEPGPKTTNGDQAATTPPPPKAPQVVNNDGEMDMDLDIEEGEVPDSPILETDTKADIEAARARLLAQLDSTESKDGMPSPTGYGDTADSSVEVEGEETEEDWEQAFDEKRSRVNMRATLNMILTVAGEFYGQRDLLEFRDPFTGL